MIDLETECEGCEKCIVRDIDCFGKQSWPQILQDFTEQTHQSSPPSFSRAFLPRLASVVSRLLGCCHCWDPDWPTANIRFNEAESKFESTSSELFTYSLAGTCKENSAVQRRCVWSTGNSKLWCIFAPNKASRPAHSGSSAAWKRSLRLDWDALFALGNVAVIAPSHNLQMLCQGRPASHKQDCDGSKPWFQGWLEAPKLMQHCNPWQPLRTLPAWFWQQLNWRIGLPVFARPLLAGNLKPPCTAPVQGCSVEFWKLQLCPNTCWSQAYTRWSSFAFYKQNHAPPRFDSGLRNLHSFSNGLVDFQQTEEMEEFTSASEYWPAIYSLLASAFKLSASCEACQQADALSNHAFRVRPMSHYAPFIPLLVENAAQLFSHTATMGKGKYRSCSIEK